jgi:hypothetical protein
LVALAELAGSPERLQTYPESLDHLVLVDTKALGVAGRKLAKGEGPAVETGAKGNGTLVGVDLDVTEGLVEVGGNDDIDGLDDTREVLVQILLLELQFEQSTVDLVDDDDRLDALTKSLTQDGLGLDADAFDGVDDDEGAVGDTQSGSDLGGEVDVAWGVDQVDEEVVLVDLDGDVLEILFVLQVCVQRNGGGLDGDASLLFIGTGIGEALLSSLGSRDDTGTLDERVGQSGLSMVDWELSARLSRCQAYSPCAMTDMFRTLAALSMSARIYALSILQWEECGCRHLVDGEAG